MNGFPKPWAAAPEQDCVRLLIDSTKPTNRLAINTDYCSALNYFVCQVLNFTHGALFFKFKKKKLRLKLFKVRKFNKSKFLDGNLSILIHEMIMYQS